MNNVPSWPSLYDPGLEIAHIEHRPPMQPGGAYLNDPSVIFRFTLYWTLVFYTPIFLICGTYAFINLAFPPSRQNRSQHAQRMSSGTSGNMTDAEGDTFSMSPRSASHYDTQTQHQPLLRPKLSFLVTSPSSFSTQRRRKEMKPAMPPPQRSNPVRSRFTFAILVFLSFITLSLLGSVLSSAVVGFTLAGLYKAAGYSMSTWVPCLWAGVVVLVGFLSVWPSIIDII